jgi:hypothetical protein
MGQITASVLSYPERGPYGSNKFRGNTSGYLIRDLILQFGARTVLDPMAGSKTTQDVCRELEVECDCLDLSEGFDAASSPLPDKRYDLIFLHPPYWNVLRFSNDQRDLSNSKTLQDFLNRLSRIILRLAHLLSKQGRMVVLIGNKRKNGRYYPLGACLEVLFMNELRDELIKIQHGVGKTFSFRLAKRYNFIPIMHEKVLVFTGFKSITWEQLLVRALTQLGGEAYIQDLYRRLANHPKTADNPTWHATIRRELQEHFEPVDGHGTWTFLQPLN